LDIFVDHGNPLAIEIHGLLIAGLIHRPGHAERVFQLTVAITLRRLDCAFKRQIGSDAALTFAFSAMENFSFGL